MACELRQEQEGENWISFGKQRNPNVSRRDMTERQTSCAYCDREEWVLPTQARSSSIYVWVASRAAAVHPGKPLLLHRLLPCMLWLSLGKLLNLSAQSSSLLSTLPTTPGATQLLLPKGCLIQPNERYSAPTDWIHWVKYSVNIKDGCPCFGKESFLDRWNDSL